MLPAFFAVLKDLWLFASGSESVVAQSNPRPAEVTKENAASAVVPAVPIQSTQFGVAYVVAPDTLLLVEPRLVPDGVIKVLGYGERVLVKRLFEQFAQIDSDGAIGWVEQDSLTDTHSKIYPALEPGFIYSAHHEETVKLRKLIADDVCGGRLGLRLQPIEYIVYLLRSQHLRFEWSAIRPRIVGQLHLQLRGKQGVRSTIEPHTGAYIESTDPDQRPFIGYVEAVHPDDSIVVSSVGRVEDGEFRKETFTRDVWKEWRPVFLTFS